MKELIEAAERALANEQDPAKRAEREKHLHHLLVHAAYHERRVIVPIKDGNNRPQDIACQSR